MKWKINSNIQSILFWSIIAAAFVGPGTVTTAANAGSSFGFDLFWALGFSVFACLLLQESAARITIASGMNLGEVIASVNHGVRGMAIKLLIAFSIVLGCAAYEAGNILGAISGLALQTDLPGWIFTLVIVLVSALILWFGSVNIIAKTLGILVALMGLAFIYVAANTSFTLNEITATIVNPHLPTGSGLLAIGLIGTTIVPYNLFLGSGISKGHQIRRMRTGLIPAIMFGGIISFAIMIVGTTVNSPFSFEALAEAMQDKLGYLAVYLFGIGLFAAGFTSSITAPMAASITTASIFSKKGALWSPKSHKYKLIWILVLATGLIFGLIDVKPIPIIIAAQALNGFILPLTAIYILIITNNPKIIPGRHLNSFLYNVLLILITGMTIVLGLRNIISSLEKTFSFGISNYEIGIISLITIGVLLPVTISIIRMRSR